MVQMWHTREGGGAALCVHCERRPQIPSVKPLERFSAVFSCAAQLNTALDAGIQGMWRLCPQLTLQACWGSVNGLVVTCKVV
jgi:hypothetical protein